MQAQLSSIMDMWHSLSREQKETMQKMINMNQETEQVTSSSTICESKSFCCLIEVVGKHVCDLQLSLETTPAPSAFKEVPPNLKTNTLTTVALKETTPTTVALKETTPTLVSFKEKTSMPSVFSEMTPLPDALTPSNEVKKAIGSKKSALNQGCPAKMTFQSFTLNGQQSEQQNCITNQSKKRARPLEQQIAPPSSFSATKRPKLSNQDNLTEMVDDFFKPSSEQADLEEEEDHSEDKISFKKWSIPPVEKKSDEIHEKKMEKATRKKLISLGFGSSIIERQELLQCFLNGRRKRGKSGMPNQLRQVEFSCVDKHGFYAKTTKRCEMKAARKYRHFSRSWAGPYAISIWKLELQLRIFEKQRQKELANIDMTDFQFDPSPFETHIEQYVQQMSTIQKYEINTKCYDNQQSKLKKATKPMQKKLADVSRPTCRSKIQGLDARMRARKLEIMDTEMKKKLEDRKQTKCPYIQSSTAKAGAFIHSSKFKDVPTIHISINYPNLLELTHAHKPAQPQSLFAPSDDIEDKQLEHLYRTGCLVPWLYNTDVAGEVNLYVQHKQTELQEALATLKILVALPESIAKARQELHDLLPKNQKGTVPKYEKGKAPEGKEMERKRAAKPVIELQQIIQKESRRRIKRFDSMWKTTLEAVCSDYILDCCSISDGTLNPPYVFIAEQKLKIKPLKKIKPKQQADTKVLKIFEEHAHFYHFLQFCQSIVKELYFYTEADHHEYGTEKKEFVRKLNLNATVETREDEHALMNHMADFVRLQKYTAKQTKQYKIYDNLKVSIRDNLAKELIDSGSKINKTPKKDALEALQKKWKNFGFEDFKLTKTVQSIHIYQKQSKVFSHRSKQE